MMSIMINLIFYLNKLVLKLFFLISVAYFFNYFVILFIFLFMVFINKVRKNYKFFWIMLKYTSYIFILFFLKIVDYNFKIYWI